MPDGNHHLGDGGGYYTMLAFMAPITLLPCERTGMSLITGGTSINRYAAFWIEITCNC